MSHMTSSAVPHARHANIRISACADEPSSLNRKLAAHRELAPSAARARPRAALDVALGQRFEVSLDARQEGID